ncbi:MAG: DUF4139 domain-containing protein [Candidatus Krumholzibacteriia bacterium]
MGITRKFGLILATLAVAVLTAAGEGAAGDAPLLSSDSSDRTRVDITVYNRNLALVREIRTVDLPAGEFTLEYREVPSAINPVTLLVEGDRRSGLAIYEQNYEFDLMSREKILQKYVGRPVAWVQEDGSRIEGVLLGMNAGPVFEVAGEIQFEVPGRIVLPDLPANLRARPTLVWRAHADEAGEATVETSYLTGGLSWNADYVLQLDGKGKSGDLQAWVSVENRSGAGFPGAKLLLVAGDVNRAAPGPEVMRDMMVMSMAEGGAPKFTEETLYDYHLYTLDRPTDLLDQQIKQISLFEAEGIKLAKHYRLRAGSHLFRGQGWLKDDTKIDVSYSFENAEGNNLGLPLPAGVFRVYGQSADGSRQLLGEDRIGHTPRDETVELTVGQAFDLVAERVRDESRKVAEKLFRYAFTITIRNHREDDVVVDVVEPVGGDWEVIESTHPAARLSATELGFQVPVKAGGKAELKYRVEVRS